MKIQGIDHVALTVSDLATAMRFYHEVFGFPILDGQLYLLICLLRQSCPHHVIVKNVGTEQFCYHFAYSFR